MRKLVKNTITLLSIIILIYTIGCISVYAASSEIEDNNSSANATSINVNQTVSGNLSKSSDVDWYKFTVSHDGYISTSFTHDVISTTNTVWKFQIYHSDGATSIDNCNSYWSVYGNKDSTTNPIGVAAGTYYIKVYSSSYYNTTYNLSVNYSSSSSWETEHNNSSDKADIIDVNKTYNGSTTSTGDVDWFKFTVPSNGYTTIDFNHDVISSTNTYWKFEIYQSDAVTRYDNCNTYWSVVGNKNFSTNQLGMAAGDYYLKIYASSHSSVPYSIKVNFNGADNWETEVNNSSSDADFIKLNSTIHGATSSSGDVDWYKIIVEQDGYISIDFEHEIIDSTNTCWKMQIFQYDAVTYYDNVNTYYSFTGNKNGSTCEMGVAAGTYYIKIYASSLSSKAYSLKVNHTADSNWEAEVNNSYSQATAIDVNKKFNGALFSSSDVDWYKITINHYCQVSIIFNHPELSSNSTYWTVTLYSSDAVTKLQTTSIAGNVASTATEYVTLDAGVYYIKVHGSQRSSATYTLQVNEQHNHSGEWVTTVAPACTSTGLRKQECTLCGLVQSETIEATGHNFDEGTVTKEAGLFNRGERTLTCSACREQTTEKIASKFWIIPVVLAGVILITIGIVNYVKRLREL